MPHWRSWGGFDTVRINEGELRMGHASVRPGRITKWTVGPRLLPKQLTFSACRCPQSIGCSTWTASPPMGGGTLEQTRRALV